MLRLALLALLALQLSAQAVMFQPVAASTAAQALGRGSDIGVWVVSVSLPPGSSLTRVQVLMAAPDVRALPNRQAEALLERKAFADPRSIRLRVLDYATQILPTALQVTGFVTGSRGYAYAGLGVSGVNLTLPSLQKRAPNAKVITSSDLLPDSISQSGQWFVVASMSGNPAPVGPVAIR